MDVDIEHCTGVDMSVILRRRIGAVIRWSLMIRGRDSVRLLSSEFAYSSGPDRARVEFATNEIARTANERASSQLPVAANAIAATANPAPAYRSFLV